MARLSVTKPQTLDCKEEGESPSFQQWLTLKSLKTGALINFNSGEAPFLEVQ